MTERSFRSIMGCILLILLYIQIESLYYVFILVLIVEAVTNWRITHFISRIRFGTIYPEDDACASDGFLFRFEAERAMRLIVAGMLIFSLVLFPEQLWFVDWIMASFLTLSGMVNLCPMVIGLRWLGFQ